MRFPENSIWSLYRNFFKIFFRNFIESFFLLFHEVLWGYLQEFLCFFITWDFKHIFKILHWIFFEDSSRNAYKTLSLKISSRLPAGASPRVYSKVLPEAPLRLLSAIILSRGSLSISSEVPQLFFKYDFF